MQADVDLCTLSPQPDEQCNDQSDDDIAINGSSVAEFHLQNQDISSPDSSSETSGHQSRRKVTGGLRLKAPTAPTSPKTRLLHTDGKIFPKRRKRENEVEIREASSLQKLIRGTWEQIHGSLSFDLKHVVSALSPIPKSMLYIYANC